MLHTTLLGCLILGLTRGSLVVPIHTTTDIPLVSTHAAVWTTLQDLILALTYDAVARADTKLFKIQRHWPDQLFCSIGIGGHLVIL
jgi:hypothetical protein